MRKLLAAEEKIRKLEEEIALLRQSEERFRTVVDTLRDGYYELDLKGDVVFYNKAAGEIFGCDPEEYLGINYIKYIVPDDYQNVFKKFNQVYKEYVNQKPYSKDKPHEIFNWRFVTKSGIVLHAETSVEVRKAADGEIIGFRGIFRNVTSQKELESKLVEEIQFQSDVVENSSLVIYRMNTKGRLTKVNPTAVKVTGYSKAELLTMSYFDLTHPDYLEEVNAYYWENIPKDTLIKDFEFPIRTKDGRMIWFSQELRVIKNQERIPISYQAISRDITAERALRNELKIQASYDKLTGLYNSATLEEKARAELELLIPGRKKAFLYIDLDHFKNVNDTYGHEAGDKILRMVADCLRGAIREKDILGRMKLGDEFGLLLPEMHDGSSAELVAQKIISRFKEPFKIEIDADTVLVKLGVSIGIAVFPDHGVSAEDIIKRADKALYAAKETGRNKFIVFTEEMENRSK